MKKLKYISRTLFTSPYHIGLCLDEAAFDREMRRLKVPKKEWPDFVIGGAHATTHFFESNSGGLTTIVSILTKKRSIDEIHALLVHEAMHVWRAICEDIGEKEPSLEFEAYAMQNICQSLFAAYRELK